LSRRVSAVSSVIERVAIVPDVVAAFTTRRAGNLSHRRPHLPSALARARTAVCEELGIDRDALHFMRQEHGAGVGVLGPDAVWGAEVRGVDALVTEQRGRALCVQVADCVPVLIAAEGDGPVAAVHAGRRGLVAGVVEATLERIRESAPEALLRAVIGPAIGGCCYEVPEELRDEVSHERPVAAATTTWGTAALDLPAAVQDALETGGVEVLGADLGCTRCDPDGRWFSHRADPRAGRQLGIILRPEIP
jgi:polyphenol oxidase